MQTLMLTPIMHLMFKLTITRGCVGPSAIPLWRPLLPNLAPRSGVITHAAGGGVT